MPPEAEGYIICEVCKETVAPGQKRAYITVEYQPLGPDGDPIYFGMLCGARRCIVGYLQRISCDVERRAT